MIKNDAVATAGVIFASGVFGFCVGCTIAAVSGEPIYPTGVIFAISTIAKLTFFSISTAYIHQVGRENLGQRGIAYVKNLSVSMCVLTSCFLAFLGNQKKSIGQTGFTFEMLGCAIFCDLIGDSRFFEKRSLTCDRRLSGSHQ